uniref:Uncharacterized protein n=1 Tax=Knipowitschia caucasica TaxID=637954 RepID=A0AAV2JHW9_KNICA
MEEKQSHVFSNVIRCFGEPRKSLQKRLVQVVRRDSSEQYWAGSAVFGVKSEMFGSVSPSALSVRRMGVNNKGADGDRPTTSFTFETPRV